MSWILRTAVGMPERRVTLLLAALTCLGLGAGTTFNLSKLTGSFLLGGGIIALIAVTAGQRYQARQERFAKAAAEARVPDPRDAAEAHVRDVVRKLQLEAESQVAAVVVIQPLGTSGRLSVQVPPDTGGFDVKLELDTTLIPPQIAGMILGTLAEELIATTGHDTPE